MADPGAEFWDQFFRRKGESGDDLDWGGLWTWPFLVPLREAGARTILELGCGTGNDAARLAREGYAVTATDASVEALRQARARFGPMVRFAEADMTQRLAFPTRPGHPRVNRGDGLPGHARCGDGDARGVGNVEHALVVAHQEGERFADDLCARDV
jgi:SAM-dependent methyltransferase